MKGGSARLMSTTVNLTHATMALALMALQATCVIVIPDTPAIAVRTNLTSATAIPVRMGESVWTGSISTSVSVSTELQVGETTPYRIDLIKQIVQS